MSGRKLSTFKRAEVNLQGQLNDYILTNYSHYYIPGLNFNKVPWIQQWNLENAMNLYKPFPYKCGLPKPLLPPVKLPRTVLANGDPATDLIVTNSYIQDDVNRILDFFQKHQNDHTVQLKKDLQWVNKNNQQETTLPRYIADLADIIEMNPDVHFEGNYNWYYTGGTLDSISFGGKELLIFPYMKEIVAMTLHSKDKSIWKPIFTNAAKCNIDDTLYELRHNVTTESCRILARFKNECTFYSIIHHGNKINMIPLDTRKSKIPYVSADLNSYDLNHYCLLKIGRAIELWDMISGKCTSKNSIMLKKCVDDEWGNVQYQIYNPNVIAFADRCCLHYLDVRESLESPVLSLCPKSHLQKCENISVCIPSNRESRYYLGTNHSLLMCDDRSPEQCVHQKWTHQFKNPPLLGSAMMRSGHEIVTISSKIPSDTAIIINTWENYDDPHSYSLPHRPPCMLDTLRECQHLGKCLDPTLRTRFNLSTVGSQLLTNDSQDVFLFSQNSIGDVFYQNITYSEEMDNIQLINSHAYYALETWERHILERGQNVMPLVLTDQANMKHIFDAFSDSKLKYELVPPVEIVLDSWKQSLDKLTSYVDILAPELLAAWDISEDVHVPQAAPYQKVLSWLEMTSTKFPESQSQESQEESFTPLTPVESQELVSVSQQCREVVNIAEDEIIEEPYYPTVKVKTEPKETKKIRKFVAGF